MMQNDEVDYTVSDKWVRRVRKGLVDQVAKERKCMGCRQPFASTHAGNRMCSACKRVTQPKANCNLVKDDNTIYM